MINAPDAAATDRREIQSQDSAARPRINHRLTLDVKAPHANPENTPSRARPDAHDRARTHFRRTVHIRLSRGGLRKSLGEHFPPVLGEGGFIRSSSSCSPRAVTRHKARGRVPPHLQAVSYVRWAPIESKAVPGYTETFQPHAWSTLPADALETLLLLSQDRHASGVVHGAQSADTTPYTTEVEVEAQTSHESEEASLPVRPDTRTGNALRGSQGQFGIGFFVSFCAALYPARIVVASDMCFVASIQTAQKMRQHGARDDVTRNIRVWFPDLRPEGDTAIRVLASAPQQPRHVVNTDAPFTQTTLPSTGAELDTVRFRCFVQIASAMVIVPHAGHSARKGARLCAQSLHSWRV